ncbi:CopG domain protein DNA-binding domain protein [Nostoc sp. HK-01]|nr:CopG domain protein DNA-binding domain protein [Nostoc sp. HK-01]
MKRVRGTPVDWNELKQHRSIMLTDTCWDLLKREADKHGISRSEFVERAARGLIDWNSEA